MFHCLNLWHGQVASVPPRALSHKANKCYFSLSMKGKKKKPLFLLVGQAPGSYLTFILYERTISRGESINQGEALIMVMWLKSYKHNTHHLRLHTAVIENRTAQVRGKEAAGFQSRSHLMTDVQGLSHFIVNTNLIRQNYENVAVSNSCF